MKGIMLRNSGAPPYVLSLWRAWPATFFQEGLAHPKRIENRKRPPPRAALGTWIAFHAGQRFDHDRFPLIAANAPEVSPDPRDHPTGLIGMAYLVGYTTSIDLGIPDDQRCWWLGPVAYLIPRVVAFDEPIPCKGQQGWKFLSDEHVDLIRERYGARIAEATP